MERPSYEVDSPYINAPNWPWAMAGWTISALHLLFFLAAWMHRSAEVQLRQPGRVIDVE